MDWNRYKQLCDSPGVFSRWMLEQTVLLVQAQAEDCGVLRHVLEEKAIAKPADHTGGSMTDMFQLEMDAEEVSRIVMLVGRAIERGDTTPATRERGLGGFAEAWWEYFEYLRGNAGAANSRNNTQ